ncbi:hypothetical protein MiTs_03213 [Microcystis aeruginosa NIES-2521]|uniref:Uncharacterized protein n=1 Tax=Microcystis aeruginosa NIES-2521 TaxID=2303983 RepID=A0A5A5S1K9_MICAE|nr:hypothetical protein MiTs_03213 [Microcystis aeruginosa NIES-2521]
MLCVISLTYIVAINLCLLCVWSGSIPQTPERISFSVRCLQAAADIYVIIVGISANVRCTDNINLCCQSSQRNLVYSMVTIDNYLDQIENKSEKNF